MKLFSFLLLTFLFNAALVQSQSDPFKLIIKLNQKISHTNDLTLAIENQFPTLDQLNKKYRSKTFRLLNPMSGRDMLVIDFNIESRIHFSDIISDYEEADEIEYIEEDAIGFGGGEIVLDPIQPDDLYFFRQWGLRNLGDFNLAPSVLGADSKIADAWDITTGSEEIVIAILDSGIKLNHPEIKNRLWVNEIDGENQLDDDDNGYKDDVNGYDFANRDGEPMDDHGHGSNVGGILGAEANNSIGYAGVNWNSKLMICKILDDENLGYYSWWIEAIYYAVDNGANVINMSVGGSSFSPGMKEAIKYAHDRNVAVVACMMNENSQQKYYPAAYEETIAVGSTDPDDERSNSFPWNIEKGSNYGEHIDLIAPGNYIYGLNYESNTNYSYYWSGTSQAAPLVTGTISLMLSLNKDLTPEEIRNILTFTADDQVGNPEEDIEGWDKYHGAGRLNAYSALVYQTTKTDHLKLNDIQLQSNLIQNGSNAFLFNPENENLNIQLISINGSILFSEQSSSKHIELGVHSCNSGIYFIHIENLKNEISHCIKLIIQ